jgi:hypothetical protein
MLRNLSLRQIGTRASDTAVMIRNLPPEVRAFRAKQIVHTIARMLGS